ncbi:MAG: hypothetical protein RR365_15030 [Bacteroides sp.]
MFTLIYLAVVTAPSPESKHDYCLSRSEVCTMGRPIFIDNHLTKPIGHTRIKLAELCNIMLAHDEFKPGTDIVVYCDDDAIASLSSEFSLSKDANAYLYKKLDNICKIRHLRVTFKNRGILSDTVKCAAQEALEKMVSESRCAK